MNFTHHLQSLINIKGHLTVAEFMQEALFNPLHGYYQKQIPIGKEGDFTTSPEISQVFGELIGLYFLNIASQSQRKIALVEMGAGKGSLYRDLLVMIQKLAEKNVVEAQEFLKKTSFHIVEISPALREVQVETLENSGVEVSWHDDFQSFLKAAPQEEIYFLANELFDCFPINQFIKTKEGWCEKVVSLKNDELAFFVEDFNPLKHKTIEGLVKEDVKENAVFEYSFSAVNFMRELCGAIKNQGGMGLIFDYGYIENSFKSSLQALKNHTYHDCLQDVGQADITSLVNFPILENVADSLTLNSSLVSQKEFLEGTGIEERRKALLLGKDEKQQNAINAGIDRLIDPDKMGELFKSLIIWK